MKKSASVSPELIAQIEIFGQVFAAIGQSLGLRRLFRAAGSKIERRTASDDFLGLPQRIKDAREAKGLSRCHLGRALGYSRQAVARWERPFGHERNSVPDLMTINDIASLLSVDFVWLITGRDLSMAVYDGPAEVAKALGLPCAAVAEWKCVPHEHIVELEQLFGLPRWVLRPDHYRSPDSELRRSGGKAAPIQGQPGTKRKSLEYTLAAI